MLPLSLKRPQLLHVDPKALLGLSILMDPQDKQFKLFEFAPKIHSATIPLEAGEEVEVNINLQDIPEDVNFTMVSATLSISEDTTAKPVKLTQTSKVSKNGTETTYSVELDMPKVPTDLTARLEEGEVFWSHTDTSSATTYPLPDLAEEVNAYLGRVKTKKGGIEIPIRLPFLIHSNNAGKIVISINSIRYSRLKTQSWKNELDGTMRLDRNIQLDFATIHELSLDPIEKAVGRSVVLRKVAMNVVGEFSPERLLGRCASHDGRAFARISNDYSLAQGFSLMTAVHCVGVHSLFTIDSETELYIEIQNDNNGSPASSKPLAKCSLTLAVPEPNMGPQWTFARFEKPVDLKQQTGYWLVIKNMQGQALLALQSQVQTYLTTCLVNRGGQQWKPICPATSTHLPLIRLVYLPEVDNQSAVVTIGMKNTTVQQQLDPTIESQSVTLCIPKEVVLQKAVLVVNSQAQGILSVANVVQEYLPE